MIEEFKNQKEIQMIVFQLGNEEYAVPITCVQEIIMPQVPTRIPKSPSYVEGVINLRGHIIPIVDGRKKFHMDSVNKHSSNEARIMVVNVDNEIIGLTVDAVSEVVHLQTDEIEPPPIDMGEDNDFLWGVGKLKNRLLILLNPQKFFTSTETGDLKKLVKITELIKQAQDPVKVGSKPVAS